MFPNMKEITESVAAYRATIEHLANTGNNSVTTV
jgi:hypothetical protein